MIRHYLLIALRNVRKHFIFSIINTAGLGLGLAICLVLTLWIQHELSYDDFHAHKKNLYRVSLEYGSNGVVSNNAESPTALLPALQKNFAEVETGVRFYNSSSSRPFIVEYNDKRFEENRFFFADSTFFQVFSFPLLQGTADQVIREPNTVVLTASAARKYFGSEDPVGKTVRINNAKEYTVTGVAADLPSNSMIRFDFVASFSSLPYAFEQIWWSANYQTYVITTPGADIPALQEKTKSLVKKELGEESTDFGAGNYVRYHFTPMQDIYLNSDVEEPEVVGNIQYVYIFAAIAFLVLLIACINYVNLATARAADRAKEVGIRKVVGALRNQLFIQFIGESLVITFMSFILALTLAGIFLPFFNELTGKSFTLTSIFNPSFFTLVSLLLISIALLAGIYPALVITGFKPVNILKGSFKTSSKGVLLRQSLVVFQFVSSIVLIIGTIIILKQLNFLQTVRLGYDKENVLLLPHDRKTGEIYEQLKTELLRSGAVSEVGRANESPTRIQGGYTIQLPGESGQGLIVTAMPIDKDFVTTLGMEITTGRNFTEGDFKQLQADTVYSFIMNESAIQELSLDPEKAIGAPVRLNGRSGVIVGVVQDFHFASLHEPINPLVMFTEDQYNYIFLRLTPGMPDEKINTIKTICASLVTHRPFDYRFLNDRYNALYLDELRMGTVCTVFAGLAILIACLGLLGLVSFAAAQKTKEIGIRKVLGATVPMIVLLITRNFIWLIVVAVFIGAPLAGYLMEHFWLSTFAYRTPVGPLPYLYAGGGLILVALLTAGQQALKAAMIDPATTLRNE